MRTAEEVVEQRGRALLREAVPRELHDPRDGLQPEADRQRVGAVAERDRGEQHERVLRQV